MYMRQTPANQPGHGSKIKDRRTSTILHKPNTVPSTVSPMNSLKQIYGLRTRKSSQSLTQHKSSTVVIDSGQACVTETVSVYYH